MTVISVLINVKLGNEFFTFEVQFYIECIDSVGEQRVERGREALVEAHTALSLHLHGPHYPRAQW